MWHFFHPQIKLRQTAKRLIWQIIKTGIVDQLGTTTTQNSEWRGNAPQTKFEHTTSIMDLTCCSGTFHLCSSCYRHRMWSTGPGPGRRAWRRWFPDQFLWGGLGIQDLPTDHEESSDCPGYPVNREEELIQLGMARGWYSYVISQPILGIFLYHDEIVEKHNSGNFNWTKRLVWTGLWMI